MNSSIAIYASYFAFGAVSFGIVSLILSNFKFKSKLMYYTVATVCGLVMGISVKKIFIAVNERNHQKLELKNKELKEIIVKSDSIKKASFKEKEILEEKKFDTFMIKYIQSYYDAYCVNNTAKLDAFYTFPMKRYYTLTNVKRDSVNERANYEHIHHKYKDCKINPNKIRINKISKDTVEVSIEQSKRKEGQVYTNIMLNKENKIFSIINIIQKPFEDSTDVKFDLLKKKTNK